MTKEFFVRSARVEKGELVLLLGEVGAPNAQAPNEPGKIFTVKLDNETRLVEPYFSQAFKERVFKRNY